MLTTTQTVATDRAVVLTTRCPGRCPCSAVGVVQPQDKLSYVQTLMANFTKTKRWSQAVFDQSQKLLKRYPA